MNQLLIGILCIFIVFLLIRSFRSEQLIQNLQASLKQRKRFLLKESSSRISLKCLESLVCEVNALIDAIVDSDSEKSGFSKQVEVTLSAIQEAVFILDEQHAISYANESAETLFNLGVGLKMQRIESVIRSPALLELLAKCTVEGNSPIEQIMIERGGESLWFEASVSKIYKGEMQGQEQRQGQNVILLVLHEITMLKKLEMVRKEFVTNVSHELRTPLTIIKGFSETLVEDKDSLTEEARARFLIKIRNNIERLHLLVEDLFTLSRLESQPEQIELSIQSLENLFMDVKDNYSSRLVEGKQSIVIDFDSEIEPFAFDIHRIHQVFDNLLENAFRYATDFNEIVISAQFLKDEELIQCSVSDDGPGIPEKSLPHLFERFYRVDKGRSREMGGTGLGLSILKHIILLHGGNVRAESTVGKGTDIIFTLPYKKSLVD